MTAMDKAFTRPVSPTLDDGRPVSPIVPSTAETPTQTNRIVVDGEIVSTFRGYRIPVPAWTRMSPLLYGATSISFPQISAHLEANAFGTGELSWFRVGAVVLIQRMNPDNTVAATDYVGVVTAIDISGRVPTLEVGGEISGRGSNRDRHSPIFRLVKDIGLHVHDALGDLGLTLTPELGPTTGIDLDNAGGGTTYTQWLTHLCSMAAQRDGTQWILRKTSDAAGASYEFVQRDATTIHATVYFDDARVIPQLRDDAAEIPTDYYARGTTPEGLIVRNAAYPGLKQGDPPAYPMAGDADFGIGTTNADTIDGRGISVMHWKLIGMHYMSRADATAAYDQETADAVADLQSDAGLTETGIMNVATWNALYDIGVTGATIQQARMLPLVQRSATRKWNLTANGSLASLNPDYDPDRLVIDRTVDFGAGVTKRQMRRWCRAQMNRTTGKNWFGTITLHSDAIAGEHVPGTALTAGDVMTKRALRENMNLWVPNFDGGTLFHIATVEMAEGGKTATLTVSTHYRDSIEIAEILDRNRETRANPARAFIAEHRSSGTVHDNITPFDEAGGRLFQDVALVGGQWNKFPVIAGQTGQISKVKIDTINAPAAFVYMVTGDEPNLTTLASNIPNPLAVTEDDDATNPWMDETVQEWLHDTLVVNLVKGNADQPCGYWPKRHTNNMGEVTAHPITGKERDYMTWPYYALKAAVIWVSIYPDRDCTIQAGQIMWAQLGAQG